MKPVALFHALVGLAVAGALATLAPIDALAQDVVTLKAVTAWSRNLNFVDKYLEWTKRVNDKGAGKIRIDYVGGPEVYPSFEQLEPLKRGVFATVVTSTAYVAGALPELNATWFGFGATPAELRASGLVNALDKVTREKTGVMVLGLPLQMRFNVYLKKPIQGANSQWSQASRHPDLRSRASRPWRGNGDRAARGPPHSARNRYRRRVRLASGRRDRPGLCARDQI